MEFVLQKLPLQGNDLSLLMRNPFLVYAFLAVYGSLNILLIAYVHMKFRRAAKTMKLLQKQWKSAESDHSTFVGAAQEKLSKLSTSPPPGAAATNSRMSSMGFEMRRQIVLMAKR